MIAPALQPTLSPEALALPHNQYHQQAVKAAREGALWCALTGIELLALKAGMKHGEWQPWVEIHCAFSYRTAARYVEAGKRALIELKTSATQPSLVGKREFEAGKARLAELLAGDGLDEQRAALIAAIRPAKPTPPPQIEERKAPAKPRKPPVPVTERPLFTPKAVPIVVQRWKKTPETVRHAFLDSIRDEALAYLTAA